jgi:hypothetical protein
VTVTASWLDDPRFARRLTRLHWVVLVTVFVLLGRTRFGLEADRALLVLLALVLALLNAPVVRGLSRSLEEAHTRAFRLVFVALALRALAACAVIALLWR